MTRFGKPAVLRRLIVATALLTGVTLVGCGQVAPGQSPAGSQGSPSAGASGGSSGSSSPAPNSKDSSSAADPFRLTSNVADGTHGVRVDKVLRVSAAHGTLSAVSVTGTVLDHGKSTSVTVDGRLDPGKGRWVASQLLEPNGDYAVRMTGTSAQGGEKTFTTSFTTQKLSLAQQVYPSFAGTLGGTVGVGTPVVLRFDLPVRNKATFQRHLHVTSSSHQAGSWHWYNDQEVHWRPKTYWKPGTRVTATADLNSIPAGNGLYGQMDTSTSFTVGNSVITKVNLATDMARVYVNGKKARTIPVSGGKAGWETRSGTSLITQKATNYRMTSQMIGLPKDGPQSYDLRVKYALRITNSGEFLHSAPWNTPYLGRQNASHGCVGMSNQDAGWLYDTAPSGSPVTITGTSRQLDPLNGLTDWNVDFATYRQGSAL